MEHPIVTAFKARLQEIVDNVREIRERRDQRIAASRIDAWLALAVFERTGTEPAIGTVSVLDDDSYQVADLERAIELADLYFPVA